MAEGVLTGEPVEIAPVAVIESQPTPKFRNFSSEQGLTLTQPGPVSLGSKQDSVEVALGGVVVLELPWWRR